MRLWTSAGGTEVYIRAQARSDRQRRTRIYTWAAFRSVLHRTWAFISSVLKLFLVHPWLYVGIESEFENIWCAKAKDVLL